jgi:hypothetical protein
MLGIKGYELPESCRFCPISYEGLVGKHRKCPLGLKIEGEFGTCIYNDKRHPDCPLVDIKTKKKDSTVNVKVDRKPVSTITEKEFRAYLEVQRWGKYNMFDIEAEKETGLTHDKYTTIMAQYSKLRELYPETFKEVFGRRK